MKSIVIGCFEAIFIFLGKESLEEKGAQRIAEAAPRVARQRTHRKAVPARRYNRMISIRT